MTKKDPVRRMEEVFEKFRSKFEPYSLFERFLEFVIAGFDQNFQRLERPFSTEETEACMELFNEWALTMQELLKHNEWYDLLGEVYMNYLAGTMKKKWTGQYFTPMHICSFMSKIVDPGEHCGERIMDNACGSGRMLLAAHVMRPGNYCCAQDLDRVCCLMTVCNFIIHGVKGEVVCGDGLNPLDFRQGWKTNELLNILGVPSVRKMGKEESFTYIQGLSLLEKASKQKETEEVVQPKDDSPKCIQLSLF